MTTPSSDSTASAVPADHQAVAAPTAPAAENAAENATDTAADATQQDTTYVSTTHVGPKKRRHAGSSQQGKKGSHRKEKDSYYWEDDSFDTLAGSSPEYVDDEFLPADEARKVIASSGRPLDPDEVSLQRERAVLTRRSRTKRAHLRYQDRRRAAMVLYEAEARDMDPMKVLELHRLESRDPHSGFPPVRPYTETLVLGVAEHLDFIDDLLVAEATHRDWEYHRLHAVDRAVLRLAVWEIFFNPELDDLVSVTEAIELILELSVEEHTGYVNAVLHRIAIAHKAEQEALKAQEEAAAAAQADVRAEAEAQADTQDSAPVEPQDLGDTQTEPQTAAAAQVEVQAEAEAQAEPQAESEETPSTAAVADAEASVQAEAIEPVAAGEESEASAESGDAPTE